MSNDQIATVLQSLADKFGVTVEYLWPRLVAYTFWYNALNVIVEIAILALAAALTSRFLAYIRQPIVPATENSQVTNMIVRGVLLAFLLITAIIAACVLPGNAAGMMAPEGKALLDLFAAFGGKKS